MGASKLTPSVVARLEKALQGGATIASACAYAGISSSTWHSWIQRAQREVDRLADIGEEEASPSEAPYVELLDKATRARAAMNLALDVELQKAAKLDWRAAAFIKQSSPASDWAPHLRERNARGNAVLDGPVSLLGAPVEGMTPYQRRLFARRLASDERALAAAEYLQEILDEILEGPSSSGGRS